MASKKLIKAVAQVQKQDVKIQQMNLNASLKKNAFAATKRSAEDREKYEGGGQVKKTRLWKLDLETRQGALFLVADLCQDPAFLTACRERAQAEEAGRAWSAVDGRLAYVGSPATVPTVPQSTTSESAPSPTSEISPAPAISSPARQMTVRFRGPIPHGHKLKALGLYYNSGLEQWNGEAVREAVEKEIAGFRHLLVSIEIAKRGSADRAAAETPNVGTVSKSGADTRSGLLDGVRVELEA